ncbi:hypothetical protein JTE90_007486 [Oedothorax gibbosus]|uniref:Uncharacterized protein n=1 Tax=Oedothorax gibbosus TaxID=931172 RepID=A0AAV6TNX3_9ARAC|nr:hypothetical protein JTE90_007486 [Oedothorax gibbosus]
MSKKENNVSRYSSNQMLMVQTERSSLISMEVALWYLKKTPIILDFGGGKQNKDQKTDANKKKNRPTEEETYDDDEENKDCGRVTLPRMRP